MMTNANIVAMFGLGTTELIIILVIVVMLFGLGKLPKVAKELGSGVRGFQKALNGEEEEPAEDAKSKKKLEEGDEEESW